MNPSQAKTLSNQADHYNSAQHRAAEQGPMHLITFWTNVCRKLAKDALKNGDPRVAEALAAHLNDFYQRYTQ
ncbi:hypothetical protein ACIRLA_22080 [Streptomyces sp. NPDC102364]|uniref:hypothetical protein n=1 Tax=Streptomyces sp. NPDC102364 TaxID=3366161 RepID=UPI0037FE5C1F